MIFNWVDDMPKVRELALKIAVPGPDGGAVDKVLALT